MHQVRFGSQLCPGPHRGSYSAPPDPIAGLRGPTSKVEGKGRERGKGENKGRGRERTPLRKFLDPSRILVRRRAVSTCRPDNFTLSKANFYVICIHTLIRFFGQDANKN